MNEKKQIAYHPGYIRKNREQAIGDIFDALVEIITNCDDSYHPIVERWRGYFDIC